MNIIIQATLRNLENTRNILSFLSNEQLSAASIPPYYSSVGSHIRHILDFYDCILVESVALDLTSRKRNMDVETNCKIALNYYKVVIEKIKALEGTDLNRIVYVTDDLGLGKTEIKYTFSGLLAQATSHTIHHYAIISYIFEGLDIKVLNDSFGYNPTTPKSKSIN
ncbi:DinB family protein [Bizionia arctica]|nr:DinB family protein [Bizionia arctica]